MTSSTSHNGFFRRNSRQIAWLTMLFVASLWAFFVYWATISRQETIHATENHLLAIVHAVEQYSDSHFKMAGIFQATTEHWLEATRQNDPRTDRQFKAFIGEFSERTDHLIDLRLINGRGDLYYFGADSDRPRDNVADREYFRAVIDSPPGIPHIGAPVISRVTGEWRLPITVRMKQPHHDFAVINASFNVSALTRAFEAERPKPNGTIGLWKSDGTLLARAPRADALLGTRPFNNAQELDRIVNRDYGVFIAETSPIDHATRLVGHARLKGFPLSIVVSTTLADVLAPWHRQLALVSLALVVVTLSGIVFSIHLANASRLQEAYATTIEQMAMHDPLTGIANRRQFFDAGEREFSRSQRSQHTLSVMMLDLDHFKSVNDHWGHPTGDIVLKGIADTLAACLRRQDLAGRLGGEEFAIILPETAAPDASVIAERIRAAVEALTSLRAENGDTVRITLSIGVATISASTASFDALLSSADRRLYLAKETGRNRIVDDDPTLPAAITRGANRAPA